MIKVKICGITNLNDAISAIGYGADALGFLVGKIAYTTGHFIEPQQARGIIDKLPPFCSTVLVTHHSRPNDVIDLALRTNVNTVQLHGDTLPKEAQEIKAKLPYLKLYKVVHVFDHKAIDDAKVYEHYIDGVVLDTMNKATGQIGGTGMTHDWTVSRELVESVNLPVILAGGLNPENIEAAIRAVKPYAVDTNSGLNNPDGTKDLVKLKAFIDMAKSL